MKWFRFYHDAIDDPKVQRLPGESFKFWVNVLCLASQSTDRGIVKLGIGEIAFATRVDDDAAATMLADLIRRELVEETTEGYAIHNWNGRQFKSDNVTERVDKYRSKQKSDDATFHATLQATTDATLDSSVSTELQITETEEQKENGADAPKSPPKAKSKRATPVPQDFTLSDGIKAWAAKKGYTIDQMESQIEPFINNHTARGTVYKDWDASFRGWMDRAKSWGQLDQKPAGGMRVVGGGFDPLRKMAADEQAEYQRRLEEAKRREDEMWRNAG